MLLFQGMQHHVLNDHNMWAYIYYFIYLNEVKENDYTSVDLYVSKMVRLVNTDNKRNLDDNKLN